MPHNTYNLVPVECGLREIECRGVCQLDTVKGTPPPPRVLCSHPCLIARMYAVHDVRSQQVYKSTKIWQNTPRLVPFLRNCWFG